MNYERGYKIESSGAVNFGIEIQVAGPNGLSEPIRIACREAASKIEATIIRDFYANDPDSKLAIYVERAEILKLFDPEPLEVKEMPNGYCHQPCCEHRPWYEITTLNLEKLTVGWRKRVLSIDFTRTHADKAEDLFPDEDVTKSSNRSDLKIIHAWNMADAKRYIDAILANSERNRPYPLSNLPS